MTTQKQIKTEEKILKEFRKKFTYGKNWKTYSQGGSPALIEPKKVEAFLLSAINQTRRETIKDIKKILLEHLKKGDIDMIRISIDGIEKELSQLK